MWTQIADRAVVQPLGGDRVVEVARRRRVDRERRQVAQVAARGDVAGGRCRAPRAPRGRRPGRSAAAARGRASAPRSRRARRPAGRSGARPCRARARPSAARARGRRRAPRGRGRRSIRRPRSKNGVGGQEAPALDEHATTRRAPSARRGAPRSSPELAGDDARAPCAAPRRASSSGSSTRRATSGSMPARLAVPRAEVAALGREVLADRDVQRAAVGERLDLLEDALAERARRRRRVARSRSCSAPVTISEAPTPCRRRRARRPGSSVSIAVAAWPCRSCAGAARPVGGDDRARPG